MRPKLRLTQTIADFFPHAKLGSIEFLFCRLGGLEGKATRKPKLSWNYPEKLKAQKNGLDPAVFIRIARGLEGGGGNSTEVRFVLTDQSLLQLGLPLDSTGWVTQQQEDFFSENKTLELWFEPKAAGSRSKYANHCATLPPLPLFGIYKI